MDGQRIEHDKIGGDAADEVVLENGAPIEGTVEMGIGFNWLKSAIVPDAHWVDGADDGAGTGMSRALIMQMLPERFSHFLREWLALFAIFSRLAQ